jgi:hypothetical protein
MFNERLWDSGGGRPLTSGSHLWRIGGDWVRADAIGEKTPHTRAVVALTVAGAHTYVLLDANGGWHLSHNKLVENQD